MATRPLDLLQKKYVAETPKSKAFIEEAASVMPGGVTANIKYYEPYPLTMKKGKGSKLIDLDGREYIDYLMGYGALATGHGHEYVKGAIIQQVESDGTWLFGTPHELEIRMGKRIQKHFPSMELIRYTNSGTEATLLAIRIAAAHTGKHKIAKFEGHYHGGYDQMLVSISPTACNAGKAELPIPYPESKGMNPSHLRNTIVLPFNDLEACSKILTAQKEEIGCVIMEPIQGGCIPADPTFIKGLRKLTEKLGILLIFDEVKTAYRTCLGGAQTIYGVQPDLTTLGKVIGGGYPVGMVGGKKQIMIHSSPLQGADVFDNSQSKQSKSHSVLFHSGTYNGHPMILAAGMAVIDILEKEIDSVLARTEKLKTGINNLLQKHGIGGKTIGMGSIFSVVLTDKDEIRNYRELQKTNLMSRKELDFCLMGEGIYTKPVNRYSVSTAHSEEDINDTLAAYHKALRRV
ncbi:aspartate aminotransferase family protein [Bacillus piscicola]|uniref:aspartate aminotransferase family protein n=1 Tax=Bacillus piscicola TaxID=1632684 RepID=UPI001F091DDE|nr:aspartate aminotransferase family protein [Bacillus piscicola]